MFRDGPIRRVLRGQIDFDNLGDIEQEWKDVLFIRYAPEYGMAMIHLEVGVKTDIIEGVTSVEADADMKVDISDSQSYTEFTPNKGKFKKVAFVSYRNRLYISG